MPMTFKCTSLIFLHSMPIYTIAYWTSAFDVSNVPQSQHAQTQACVLFFFHGPYFNKSCHYPSSESWNTESILDITLLFTSYKNSTVSLKYLSNPLTSIYINMLTITSPQVTIIRHLDDCKIQTTLRLHNSLTLPYQGISDVFLQSVKLSTIPPSTPPNLFTQSMPIFPELSLLIKAFPCRLK